MQCAFVLNVGGVVLLSLSLKPNWVELPVAGSAAEAAGAMFSWEGKKKTLKQPKRQAKEMDEIGTVLKQKQKRKKNPGAKSEGHRVKLRNLAWWVTQSHADFTERTSLQDQS